jgi:Fe-S-cluster containining protein
MSQELAVGKEALWLACREKNCCYTALVLTSGRDVWRISKTLQTPPWTYLMYFQSPPRPDAFVLDDSGMYFRMALSKGPTRRKKSPPPCIFLTRTRAGHHRCGLGDLRPQVCRAFPSEMVSGVLCVRNDGGCTCRVWALADVDITEESRRVQARYDEFKEYCEVVAYWNSLVRSAPNDMNADFYDFCNFLMEAYDEMEAQGRGAAEVGMTGEAR